MTLVYMNQNDYINDEKLWDYDIEHNPNTKIYENPEEMPIRTLQIQNSRLYFSEKFKNTRLYFSDHNIISIDLGGNTLKK